MDGMDPQCLIFSSKRFDQFFLSEVSNFMFSFLTVSFKFECFQVEQIIFYTIIFSYFSFPFLVKVINIPFAPQMESLEDVLSYF